MFSLRDLKEGDVTTNVKEQSRRAYQIYQENFSLCFGLELAPAALMGTLLVLTWNNIIEGYVWTGLSIALGFFVCDLSTGAIIFALGGRKVGEFFTTRTFGPFLAWSLLTKALIFLAWQAWCLPGAYLAAVTIHMPYLMVLEGRGGWEALKGSFGLLHRKGSWSYLRKPVREVLVTEHILLGFLSCWLPNLMNMAAQGLGYGSGEHAITLLVAMCLVQSLALALVIPWAGLSHLLHYLGLTRGEKKQVAA